MTIGATVLSAERSTAGHAFDRDRMRRAAEALRVQRDQVRTRLFAGGKRIRTIGPARRKAVVSLIREGIRWLIDLPDVTDSLLALGSAARA